MRQVVDLRLMKPPGMLECRTHNHAITYHSLHLQVPRMGFIWTSSIISISLKENPCLLECGLSAIRVEVTYKTGFGLDNWIYWHLIHSQLGTIRNTALALFYTLSVHRCIYSQPSLVVSWQRIYNSLSFTSNHTWNLICIYHFFSITFDCHLQNSTQFFSDHCCVISKRLFLFPL
jgi:hypothetical protein